MDATAPADTTGSTAWAGGRHPVDIGHLVMGLAFLGLVAVWAVIRADVVGGDEVRFLLPLPWVLAGAIGLVVTTMSGMGRRRRHRPAEDTAAQPVGRDVAPAEREPTGE